MKILACVDSSTYAETVSACAAWVHERTGASVILLHALLPAHPQEASQDLSGAIGLGAKSELLEHLAELDETHGRMEQHKGKLLLKHAEELLRAQGIEDIEVLHRRGSLLDVITEVQDQVDLIILGKRGEHANFDTLHLGSNLERVVRSAHKPVLVSARRVKPIQRFLLAFDGSPSARKALEYISREPLFKGLECHVMRVGRVTPEAHQSLIETAKILQQAGFSTHTAVKMGKPDETMAAYVETAEIDLLVMGAYKHSRIRDLIIGSTTTAMMRSCHIPILLFR